MATWPANGTEVDTWDAALQAWLTAAVFDADGSWKDNFAIDTSFTVSDACDIGLGTTTGTKIGTAAGQKLGFYGATPVVQPANTSDIKDALVALGLLADSGATPLNTDGGALTCGDIYPGADNTYYLGKNDDDSPAAWRGVVLADTVNGKRYRIEVVSGTITATDLTD